MNNHEAGHNQGSEEMAGMPTEQNPETRAEPMMRKAEIAEWLKVTPRTLNNYMRERRIPFHKGPKLVWFKMSEVQAALFGKIDTTDLK
jgi:hypothetical protein